MNADFLLRLPLYSLALCLSGIEYVLRMLMADTHRFEFLPTAIVSASLGFLVPLIVHDLPQAVVDTLTSAQQRTLSLLSSSALIFFFLGFVLWFVLTGTAMKPELANNKLLNPVSTFVWAFSFYLVGIFLTEMKARVLQ